MATPAQATAGPTIVTITDGQPDPETANVNVGSTLQFNNQDHTDYRIWGLRVARYLGIDVLLPARGSVTLLVDTATEKGQSSYELFPTNLQNRYLLANRGIGPFDGGGGGGQIIVGP